MPELPEVETVRAGLVNHLPLPILIEKVGLGTKALRFPWPKGLRSLKKFKIVSIERRAKYLILMGEERVLISHLGMTGTWRIGPDSGKKHDHIKMSLSNGQQLIYNDPRRFGYVDLIEKKSLETCRWLAQLGPEPLDSKFNKSYLLKNLKNKNQAIKVAIMDQSLVVGVGNIYASEALFYAKLSPHKTSCQVTAEECAQFVSSIKKVIRRAIKAGGTTISDFKQVSGGLGYFAQSLKVYGRQGEPCKECQASLKSAILAGRNTFYCPSCQSE